MVSRDTTKAEVRQEYAERGWFCRNAGVWMSGPWRTQKAAMLAAQGKHSEARRLDTAEWRKLRKRKHG